MAIVQISEALDHALQQAAERLGRSKEDLVQEALQQHLEQETPAPLEFRPEQIERMRQSVAQLERREVVSSDEVDIFFNEWRKELAAG